MAATKLTCPECNANMSLGCRYWPEEGDGAICPTCKTDLEFVYRKGKGKAVLASSFLVLGAVRDLRRDRERTS